MPGQPVVLAELTAQPWSIGDKPASRSALSASNPPPRRNGAKPSERSMRLIEASPAAPRKPGAHPCPHRWEWGLRVGIRQPVWPAGLPGAGWGWRLELAAVAMTVALWSGLAAVASRPVATVMVAALLASVLASARVRGWLGWVARRARLRRRWGRACRHARLETFNERTPRITRMTRVPVGEVLRVRLPAGQPVTELETRAETLAAYLQIREVQVVRDPDNARYADIALVRRDALAGTVRLGWPNLDAVRLSVWEPVPVGVDEHARPVTIRLVERNLLLGGEPGAGKSVAQSLLLATAALDPEVDLWLLDGKRVELAAWRGCARALVGPDVDEAIDVLRRLQAEMEQRYELLLDQRRRKVEQGDGLRLQVVGCDELAFYTAGGERKAREEFNRLSTDVIRRGRAAGIIWIAATQKPAAHVVPTSLRDLVGYRWALRCATRAASDTILGAGMATPGSPPRTSPETNAVSGCSSPRASSLSACAPTGCPTPTWTPSPPAPATSATTRSSTSTRNARGREMRPLRWQVRELSDPGYVDTAILRLGGRWRRCAKPRSAPRGRWSPACSANGRDCVSATPGRSPPRRPGRDHRCDVGRAAGAGRARGVPGTLRAARRPGLAVVASVPVGHRAPARGSGRGPPRREPAPYPSSPLGRRGGGRPGTTVTGAVIDLDTALADILSAARTPSASKTRPAPWAAASGRSDCAATSTP